MAGVVTFPPMPVFPGPLPPPAGQVIVSPPRGFPPIAGPLALATVAQLKQGLAVADPGGKVKYNLPADPVNTITIGWYEDQFPNSGALYNFIALQLGYTASQMISFYASLSSYPARP
jgi:hypothetical protein